MHRHFARRNRRRLFVPRVEAQYDALGKFYGTFSGKGSSEMAPSSQKPSRSDHSTKVRGVVVYEGWRLAPKWR